MCRENIFVSFILVLSVQARNTVRSADPSATNIQTNSEMDAQHTGSILMLSNANDKDTWDSNSNSNGVDTQASGKCDFMFSFIFTYS